MTLDGDVFICQLLFSVHQCAKVYMLKQHCYVHLMSLVLEILKVCEKVNSVLVEWICVRLDYFVQLFYDELWH